MMDVISSYPFTKTVDFRIDNDGVLKGVSICGPGRDQRSYYAVKPQMGEGTLYVDVFEEALKILEIFNKEGYMRMIDEIIPATVKTLGEEE